MVSRCEQLCILIAQNSPEGLWELAMEWGVLSFDDVYKTEYFYGEPIQIKKPVGVEDIRIKLAHFALESDNKKTDEE